MEGGVGINGGLEKFKKPNRQGGWKMIQNVINRGLGVWNQQRSKLSASDTIETKETMIIKNYMQILQILMQSIFKNSSGTFKNSQELSQQWIGLST